MKPIHNREKEQFKKLFKQDHTDNFEKRFQILEVFLQTERHVTAEELIQLLNENGYQIDSDLVRDTLKLMCRYGFAHKNSFLNGIVRYEHRHLGQHHDHMICTKCMNIIEFENEQLEKLQEQIASAYDFHMLQHKMEIYGICSECLKDRAKLIPLINARQGERLEIKDFRGGSDARMRLLSMGIRMGDTIQVISNIGKGQVVVSADYKRYVLGRGLAQKVLVEPIS